MPRPVTSDSEHARYQRERYANDPEFRERTLGYIAKYRPKRKEQMRQLLVEAKASGCVRCDEKDPAVLDFHHVEPRSFYLTPATCAQKGVETVKAELAKCIVLCANCHRREHAQQAA